MYKALFRFITFLCFILLPFLMVAQTPDDMERGGAPGQKEKKMEKDTIKSSIGLWNLNGYGAFQDSTKLDTLHDVAHIFHPVYKKALTATYVGNYGTPALDNNFFNRNYNTQYFFWHSREAYILTPADIAYYNTTTPYTRLDYSQSENKSNNNETRFNVIHSQNINPFWNFTLRTNQEKSDGQYNAQESKNNFITLYTSYNKDNWNVYGGLISNKVQNNENGGLNDEKDWLNAQEDPDYWSTNLNSSTSKLTNRTFYANGEYRLGKLIEGEEPGSDKFIPLVGVLYSFNHDRNTQTFIEEEDDDNTFFENTYFGDDYTTDKIKFNKTTNILQLKQYENADKKFSFGKRAYAGHELSRGSMPLKLTSDSTDVERMDIKYSSAFLGGGIYRETGKFWRWNFDGKLYFLGRNLGQTEINGNIAKPFKFWGDSTATLNLTGAIENRVPDYFQERFISNHIQWRQDLEMEQRMTVGGSIKIPKRKFEIGAKYSIINNYIYNDTLGIPDQTGEEILVLAAYLDKDFSYNRFHFRTRLLWQKASNETYIHLPAVSAFVSTYYQFTISKVMFTQIGADVRYNTSYYADAYAPSTGLFYLQNETKLGNYPYIDIYATLRLKRTKVFFKYMNVGTHFLDGTYMTTPTYPMNRATFRLGVSWAFYD